MECAMRVAIPTWCDRVSPVFDVARRLLLVDVAGRAEVSRTVASLEDTQLVLRAKCLADLGVNTLICWAISAQLQSMLTSIDVRVIPHACGPVEDVLRAFLAGRLGDDAFLMPGCCARRQRIRRRHRCGPSESDVQGDVV